MLEKTLGKETLLNVSKHQILKGMSHEMDLAFDDMYG